MDRQDFYWNGPPSITILPFTILVIRLTVHLYYSTEAQV